MAEISQIPQKMAYDRASIVFSPEGRLYQVEYARQAVEKASTTIGIVFKDGVVLLATKIRPKLLVSKNEKVFKIDEHIGVAACGLIADSRALIDFARVQAQINRITYNEPIEITALVKEISDREQIFTQYAGIRPYGVSLLIAGSDGGHHLFETDPSGTVREWKAHAIGREASQVRKILIKKYKDNMKKDDAIKLGISVLRQVEKKISVENLEIGVVENKKFKLLKAAELKKYLK
ncbi:MAG: archaeal proteasome endopeptidase complex subunit alpha [Candidatus Aenigmarchaeota archaeon]|nr:archaeal proteasome endopeptidase complex subunit alpha [Candidatus Aenigmarchaeota archaeon]